MATSRSRFDGDKPAYTPFPLPGDRPHFQPDRVADIRHLRLELDDFDFASRSYSGRCTVTLAPIVDEPRAITFDAVEFEDLSVSDADGRPLSFSYDGKRLRVQFAHPPRAGVELVLDIRYQATPRRGLYFNVPDEHYPDRPRQIWTQGQDEDSRYWFPCHDQPNQKQTSELIATVPAGMFALSNGSLVRRSEDADAGTVTFHWSQEVPHSPYLMTLAAGGFGVVEAEGAGIPLQYYVEQGREAEAARTLARTPAMMQFFVDRLGPYPYPKYAQVFVADFIFGGMENTSATTLTDVVLHDERAARDFDADGLVAHELAHQWFGDLLTCREWAHGWLNEGFATYWEALFTEQHKGEDEFRYELFANARFYLDEDSSHYRRPIVQTTYRQPIDIFDRHLYEKGSLVLHMLRYVLGDEPFFRAMRLYVERNARQNVQTIDLQRAIEAATGRNLDWFFDQWVFKGGHPVFEVNWSWDDEHGQAKVTVKQTQKPDAITPLFRTPLDLSFALADGTDLTQRVEIEEAEHRFAVPLPSRPRFVRFDPGNHILKALTFERDEPELTAQLSDDPDVIGRVRAAQSLGKKATRSAVLALANAARADRFWGVQAEAAKALGEARTTAARDALIGLLDLPHPKARRAVVEALGAFRNDEVAAEAVLGVARAGDPSYFVEAEAAKTLGRVRSRHAWDAIETALTKDSWNEVIRARALDGLAELKDPRALDLALAWTAAGKPQPARAAAIAAVAKLGKGARKDEAVERLAELLDDPWLRVVQTATAALRDLKAEDAVPALQRLVERHLDGRAIRGAREAIRAIREAGDTADELAKLRERLDALERDNRDLRDRLDALTPAAGSGAPPEPRT